MIRPPKTLVAAALVIGAAVSVPLVYLIVRGASSGVETMAEIVLERRTLALLVRTSFLAASVTVTTIMIGVPLAWLTERTDLPGRRIWSVLVALPLVVPSYIGGYTFVAALGPRGLLQRLLTPLGVERLPSIYGWPGAWLVLALFTYPYVFLTTSAAIRGLDHSLEEAARTLGRNRWGVFSGVVLPQLRPAVGAGALLVALYALRDFGAVSLMQFDSFTRAIYVSYQASFDRTPAAVLSIALVALTMIVLGAEFRLRGRASYFPAHAAAPRPPKKTRLGGWRWPAFIGCLALVLLALGLPLGVIGYWLGRGLGAGVGVALPLAASLNTLEAAALGSVVCLAAAIPIARLVSRYPSRTSGLAERLAFVGYSLPGIVVALSLVFLSTRLIPAVYQTQVLLVFAYLVLFLPQAAGAVKTSMMQMSPQLEDAARLLGFGRLAAFRKVTLPVVFPGVLAGGALVFLTIAKELPATLLLAPAGFSTLATRVWGATSEGLFARAAPAALALVLLSSLPLALMAFRKEERPDPPLA